MKLFEYIQEKLLIPTFLQSTSYGIEGVATVSQHIQWLFNGIEEILLRLDAVPNEILFLLVRSPDKKIGQMYIKEISSSLVLPTLTTL